MRCGSFNSTNLAGHGTVRLAHQREDLSVGTEDETIVIILSTYYPQVHGNARGGWWTTRRVARLLAQAKSGLIASLRGGEDCVDEVSRIGLIIFLHACS